MKHRRPTQHIRRYRSGRWTCVNRGVRYQQIQNGMARSKLMQEIYSRGWGLSDLQYVDELKAGIKPFARFDIPKMRQDECDSLEKYLRLNGIHFVKKETVQRNGDQWYSYVAFMNPRQESVARAFLEGKIQNGRKFGYPEKAVRAFEEGIEMNIVVSDKKFRELEAKYGKIGFNPRGMTEKELEDYLKKRWEKYSPELRQLIRKKFPKEEIQKEAQEWTDRIKSGELTLSQLKEYSQGWITPPQRTEDLLKEIKTQLE